MSYTFINRNKNYSNGRQTFSNWSGTPCDGAGEFVYQPAEPDLTAQMALIDPVEKKWKYDPVTNGGSWKQIRKSGSIKFTNYVTGKSTVTHHVVDVPVYAFSLGWPNCNGTPVSSPIRATSTWTTSYNWELSQSFPSHVNAVVTGTRPEDIESERNALRSKVVSDNVRSYDLLTELAEAKETAELILAAVNAARHPLEAFANFLAKRERNARRGINGKSDLTELGDAWLQVRYGIMPLYYSIQDIIKTKKSINDQYKTSRARKNFSYTVGGPPSTPEKGMYTYAQEEVELTFSAVGKSRYKPAASYLRLLDQVGFNPFVTAWELIPFSFVVDWFANIGDWVLARTSSFTGGAEERSFCEIVKEKRVIKTYLVADVEYSATKDYPWGTINAGPVFVKTTGLLREEHFESYTRNLFGPSDVHLQSDILLNWKRTIDAWALGHKPLLQALRKLSK